MNEMIQEYHRQRELVQVRRWIRAWLSFTGGRRDALVRPEGKAMQKLEAGEGSAP